MECDHPLNGFFTQAEISAIKAIQNRVAPCQDMMGVAIH